MDNLILTPISLDAMEERFSNMFDQKIAKLLSGMQTPQQQQDELLTRKEAAKLLGISLVTLNDWTKEGKVTGYRIASRVRYKKSELSSALCQIKSAKIISRA